MVSTVHDHPKYAPPVYAGAQTFRVYVHCRGELFWFDALGCVAELLLLEVPSYPTHARTHGPDGQNGEI